MLLLIDAGNTKLKWACIPLDLPPQFPAAWTAFGAVEHHELAQMGEAIAQFRVQRCIISNVAGAALQQAIEHILLTHFPTLAIEKFSAADKLNAVQNCYRDPAKLGSDRFASAIAAHYQFPEHDLVVATCGTATTVDAITAHGVFLGGMILPGLQLMASSLANNTAQLPQIALQAEPLEVFAKQTDQAIASGCLHAQIGALWCAVQHLEQQRGQDKHVESSSQPVKLIISGGAAPYLVPQLQRLPNLQWQVVENLVLSGLWIVSKSS